jgi:hypothetical protein
MEQNKFKVSIERLIMPKTRKYWNKKENYDRSKLQGHRSSFFKKLDKDDKIWTSK